MRGVIRRFLVSAAAASIFLSPITASADTPSPSPTLDTVLAKPPTSDYVQLTTGTFHGDFTAHDWAVNSSGATPTETETTLNHYGFVGGYGLEWTTASPRRALVEIVMAFTGGQGAQKTLTALERADKSDPHYQHANTLSGITPSYGVHLFDSSRSVYEDGFGFTKGNDLFTIYFASTQDDNLTLATTQSKTQFDGAPDSTIPSSQWPENAQSSNSAAFSAGSAIGVIIVLVLVLGVIGVVVGLVMRGRRRTPAFAQAYAPAATSAVQMSPDGKYWYDGQAWRDASAEAPPGAQRSSDGTLWWDGQTWRPVPQSGPPPQAPPTSWPS
jgi:hypothetical protein